jgi:uncharacterized protein YcbX
VDTKVVRKVEADGRAAQAVLTALFIYPVKSTRGIALTHAEIVTTGLKWDRRWMIVDEKGLFITQRTHSDLARVVPEITKEALVLRAPGLPDLSVPLEAAGSPLTVKIWDFVGEALETGKEAHEWLSRFLGEPVRLVTVSPGVSRIANPKFAKTEPAPINFPDGYPFLVCNAASLRDLNNRLPQPVRMECFRPNLVLEGLDPWAEDEIETLDFGGATLRLVKPCTRCAIPSRNFETGESAVNPLPVLRKFRWSKALSGVLFGENATLTAGGGTLTLGSRCRIRYRRTPRSL